MVREGVPANRNCVNKSSVREKGHGAFLGMEDDARTERVWEEGGARKAGGV